MRSSVGWYQFLSCSETSRCLKCSQIIKDHSRSLIKIFTLDTLEKIIKHFLPLCWSHLKRACNVRFLMMLVIIQRRKALEDLSGMIPYRIKIYTKFNLATGLRLVKFTELNISEFLFMNFNYLIYKLSSREIPKDIIKSRIWI